MTGAARAWPAVQALDGGYDPDDLYVALVRADDGEVVAKVSGNVEETLRAQYRRRTIDASDQIGEELYIEIVDRSTGGFGHLSVDDVNVPVALTRADGRGGRQRLDEEGSCPVAPSGPGRARGADGAREPRRWAVGRCIRVVRALGGRRDPGAQRRPHRVRA
ncbi:hypothetical protein [Cellulomonas sp.]|uniref:hypothetical protein n=1 Tax=Cellulomonas sp. TaxID=40001 RepID=UPI0028126C80|nr:hypothetical protein [Cellulomonas sp.]